jgi:cation:H+ antiporter
MVKALGLKTVAKIVGFISGGASALWTFPSVIGSAMLIAWGAEAAQFLISQGMALAILAWLQTLPEFAVEAVISWDAGKDPTKTHLMIANLTGSLRLLVGLGWPMIYFVAATVNRRSGADSIKEIVLEREHSIEITGLGVPILYFLFIWYKGTLEWYDSIILTAMYAAYLIILNKIPPQAEEKIEDMERVPRWILQQKPRPRLLMITTLFLGGGIILYFVAHPFLYSMLALATGWGISSFVFVQWVAPFLSEFPEKVSAFYWARRVKTAPMALMNMVSSNINQWTVLAAMLPIVFSLSAGQLRPIVFDHHQELEILLTISQSMLGMVLLSNMKFSWWEALAIFTLWGVQFVFSNADPRVADLIKQVVTAIYFAWTALEVIAILVRRQMFEAFSIFPQLIREHW